MIKSYKANTNISINVVLPGSKKNLHIAFVPLSDGSSVFSTENEEIQKGMERHYEFGSLFRFVGAADTRKPRNAPAKAQTKEESAPEEAEGTGKTEKARRAPPSRSPLRILQAQRTTLRTSSAFPGHYCAARKPSWNRLRHTESSLKGYNPSVYESLSA